MRYRVSGADRATGQDVTRVIDAPSPNEAEKIGMRSMLVAGVEVEATPQPPVAQAAPSGFTWLTRGFLVSLGASPILLLTIVLGILIAVEVLKSQIRSAVQPVENKRQVPNAPASMPVREDQPA